MKVWFPHTLFAKGNTKLHGGLDMLCLIIVNMTLFVNMNLTV